MSTIAIVGGGITGLAAAWHLATRRPGHEVVLVESTSRLGGKLDSIRVAGHVVDGGAESVLARRPEALELMAEIDAPLVHPERFPASLWSRGAMTPMPAGTLMGVPSDPSSLRGLLTDDEVARVRDEHSVDLDGADIGIGDLVERACGSAVVDRLVEPLLGGVYAGHARALSARACMPALWEAAAAGRSLLQTAARAAEVGAARRDEPVFAAVDGGLGTLPARLAEAARGAGVTIRTGAVVSGLTAEGPAWRLRLTGSESGAGTGDAAPATTMHADAVLLATPAAPTARLLSDPAPDAAAALRTIEYASMALVTFAFRASDSAAFEGTTGFLVPPVDGAQIKASTFSSSKWPWLTDAVPDLRFVRVSLGRHGEERVLQKDDADLIRIGLADLRKAVGAMPEPVDAQVRRWGGGLPQYAVGHLDTVASIRAATAAHPTLALAGAAYDGVGIPACIASGRRAAEELVTRL
ncbi:protoporphyrinogen oxidase [Allobranchiibius huperziae]|uniref:Coproporphyrinogen III oxidase n=1 Tax=Allobranchiibius huperziae TaxID=1874116 RepID=A0A853DC99_9MICO|nr:protoporphyrinogen oxidase [Allobranchiibius huperziae]NYJ74962.1 oxygen-dependent protoporphyrinogen oxidase [Allobranchiibius huperziae]